MDRDEKLLHNAGIFSVRVGDVVIWNPVVPKLVIERTHPDAVIPTYASEGDSGMDVYAIEDYDLEPGETKLFKLGFKMQIPRHPFHALGYRWEAQMRPRSGVSMKTSVRVANSPGTIDNFYINEVGVLLQNTESKAYELDVEKTTIEGETVVDSVKLETPHYSYGKDLKGEVIVAKGYPLENSYVIRKGDRIAQIVFNEVIRPLEIIEGIVDTSEDRGGGFGHSGLK